jgi:hypothetical protein
MSRRRATIRPNQHQTRIAEATNMFHRVAMGANQNIEIFKSILDQYDRNKEDASDEQSKAALELTNGMVGLITAAVTNLEDGAKLVGEPPQYYPFSDERLMSWEMALALNTVQPIMEQVTTLVSGIQALGTLIEEIADSKNEPVTLEAELES